MSKWRSWREPHHTTGPAADATRDATLTPRTCVRCKLLRSLSCTKQPATCARPSDFSSRLRSPRRLIRRRWPSATSPRRVRVSVTRSLSTRAEVDAAVAIEGRSQPFSLEATRSSGRMPIPPGPASTCRAYARTALRQLMQTLIGQLQASNRTSRIEELRSTDRFYVLPSLTATFDGSSAQVEDLSARGARVVLPHQPERGAAGTLQFGVPDSDIEVTVKGELVKARCRCRCARSARSRFSGGTSRSAST